MEYTNEYLQVLYSEEPYSTATLSRSRLLLLIDTSLHTVQKQKQVRPSALLVFDWLCSIGREQDCFPGRYHAIYVRVYNTKCNNDLLLFTRNLFTLINIYRNANVLYLKRTEHSLQRTSIFVLQN